MTLPTVGSVWSVAGVRNGVALVIAGPFGPPEAPREFLIAPLYGAEPNFVWTNWDVLVRPEEGPFDSPRYAAVWNVRPVLEYDLDHQLGDVTSGAVTAVRDVYWASLNEERLGNDPRLGKPLRWWNGREGRFQRAELERWALVSGRVLTRAERATPEPWGALAGPVTFSFGPDVSAGAVLGDVLRTVPPEVYDHLVPQLVPTHAVFFSTQVQATFLPIGTNAAYFTNTVVAVPPARVEVLTDKGNRLPNHGLAEAA